MSDTLTPSTRLRFLPSDWFALVLAFALMTLLFPIAVSRLASNQPWRAEMLTTLFLFVSVIVLYFRDREYVDRLFSVDKRTRPLIVLLTAFTVWGLISSFWSHSAFSARHHTLVWMEFILFFLFVRENLSRTPNIRFVTSLFLWLSGIIGILCLIDYATLPDFKALEGVLRARYSSYAELLVTALPIAWAAAIYARKKANYHLIVLAAVLGWTAAMLSLSKGAFLAGIIGFTVMFLGSLVFGNRCFRSRILVSLAIWLAVTLFVQIGFSLLTPIPATMDYISGKADATRATSTARIFVWKVSRQMITDNWLMGVGADNFGVSFNDSRAKYRVTHPDAPKDEIVSDFVVERAHNELIQILAELGVVGISLILAALAIFLFYFIRALSASGFKLSPMLWAAVGGMSAFAFSSMVSSFSLRLVQNGIVFFIVFAVAVNEILKAGRSAPKTERSNTRRPAFAFAMLLLLAMLSTHALKAAAEYTVYTANRETDKESALRLYTRATTLDPDYAVAYLKRSGRSFTERDFAAAAKDIRIAIDHGVGVVLTYSVLADCYTNMGNMQTAERTFDEALRIYPRSVFLRVRYSLFLGDEGRTDDSAVQMSAAREIDPPQANGWLSLLTIGSTRSFYAAQTDSSLAPPADLLPAAAVLQYLDKPPSDSTH